MLKLSRAFKVNVFFLVLVYVFYFNLFEFSAAILEKGVLPFGEAKRGRFGLFFIQFSVVNVLAWQSICFRIFLKTTKHPTLAPTSICGMLLITTVNCGPVGGRFI